MVVAGLEGSARVVSVRATPVLVSGWMGIWSSGGSSRRPAVGTMGVAEPASSRSSFDASLMDLCDRVSVVRESHAGERKSCSLVRLLSNVVPRSDMAGADFHKGDSVHSGDCEPYSNDLEDWERLTLAT